MPGRPAGNTEYKNTIPIVEFMENEFLIPFDFLLLLLVIAVIVTVVVLVCCGLKRRRLNRLTSPRKDYYRPSGHGEHRRSHRIGKIEG